MKLFEILDQSTDFEIKKETKDGFVASFPSNGRVITFIAQHKRKQKFFPELDDEEDTDPTVWEILFKETSTGRDGISRTVTQKTGSGKELEVFATVKKIIEHFMSKYNPPEIIFSSKKSEENRGNLYAKLFKKHLTGYDIVRDDKLDKDYAYFRLKKK
jgi:hypothetical protein